MTRSTASPFSRQYSWARSTSLTTPESSTSSMRTSTIGRSPEMPCAHRTDAVPRGRGGSCPTRSAAPDWHRTRVRPGADRGWPGRGDVEMAQLHLRLRPGQRGRPFEGVGVLMLVDGIEQRLARSRHDRPEGDTRHAARRNPHAPAQREYRIEHGSDGVGEAPSVRSPRRRCRRRCRGRESGRDRSRSRPRRSPRPRRPRDGRPTARLRPGCGADASPGWRRRRRGTRSGRTAWRRPGARRRPPAAPARSRHRR